MEPNESFDLAEIMMARRSMITVHHWKKVVCKRPHQGIGHIMELEKSLAKHRLALLSKVKEAKRLTEEKAT